MSRDVCDYDAMSSCFHECDPCGPKGNQRKGHAVSDVRQLERDLVGECRVIAKAMNVQLVEMGQRRAKGSGSTIGLPDLAVNCAGRTVWIETKRAHRPGEGHGCLSMGQEAFIAKAAEQGVRVFVVDRVEDFISIVNAMRRKRGVG